MNEVTERITVPPIECESALTPPTARQRADSGRIDVDGTGRRTGYLPEGVIMDGGLVEMP